jgi:hypothetical protein
VKNVPVIVAQFAPNPVGIHLQVIQLVLVAVIQTFSRIMRRADLAGMAGQESQELELPRRALAAVEKR